MKPTSEEDFRKEILESRFCVCGKTKSLNHFFCRHCFYLIKHEDRTFLGEKKNPPPLATQIEVYWDAVDDLEKKLEESPLTEKEKEITRSVLEYIDGNGEKCMYCGESGKHSYSIYYCSGSEVFPSLVRGGSDIRARITCFNCNHEWVNIYRLCGVKRPDLPEDFIIEDALTLEMLSRKENPKEEIIDPLFRSKKK